MTAKAKADREVLGVDRKPMIAARASQTKHAKLEELSLKNRGIEKDRLMSEMTEEVMCHSKEQLKAYLSAVKPEAPPRVRRCKREPSQFYRRYTNAQRRLMLRLRYGTEVAPFGEPRMKFAPLARLMRIPVQTLKDIIRRAVNGKPVDGRKSHPRTHPQLTEDIINLITDNDLLCKWKNLSLVDRVHRLANDYGIHLSAMTLRKVYLKHRIHFRKSRLAMWKS